MIPAYTASVTLIALLEYQVITMNVGRARVKFGVKAPAVTGHESFERAYRVQMNTVEQMAFFLPALWLCALLLSDRTAAAVGLVWIIGRALYALAYIREPSSRGPGMMISFIAATALFLGAAFGLIKSLI